jgi:hypothetical protein
MEGLAPSLQYCLDLELYLEVGESVRTSIVSLQRATPSSFSSRAAELLCAFDQGAGLEATLQDLNSPYERTILEILARGLTGEPILSAIRVIRQELEVAAAVELDQYMAKLPLLSLVPLLFLLLPAFLILLFGPLSQLMLKGMM